MLPGLSLLPRHTLRRLARHINFIRNYWGKWRKVTIAVPRASPRKIQERHCLHRRGIKLADSFVHLFEPSHITGVTKKIWHYVFIRYSAYIMYTSSGKTRADGWPWIGSLIPSSSKHTLFHRGSEIRNICSRLAPAEKKRGRERKRERQDGEMRRKGQLEVSLTLERENISHDVKAKEGHALHPSRLLNVNAWDDSRK